MTELVGLVVVSHSRQLARAAVELAREMAQGAPVRIAVAAGIEIAARGDIGGSGAGAAESVGLGTDATAIVDAITEADGPAGVLVLMDLGSALLSAELALELLADDVRNRVLLSPAPLVEGLVTAVVAAAGGAALAEVAAEAAAGTTAKREHLGVEPAEPAEPAVPAGGVLSGPAAGVLSGQHGGVLSGPAADRTEPAARGTFVVTDPHGLHARPAARLVAAVRAAGVRVDVVNLTAGRGPEPGVSLSRVAALGALTGHEIEVRVLDGSDPERTVADVLAAVSGDAPSEGPVAVPAVPAAASVRPVVAPAAPTEAPVRPVAAARPLAASPGVAFGPAFVRAPAVRPDRPVPGSPDVERARLTSALAGVRADVEALRNRAESEVGPAEAAIFAAHRELLDDPEVLADAERRIADGAEAAWTGALGAVEASWLALPGSYLAERITDLAALRDQVLAALRDRVLDAPRDQVLAALRDRVLDAPRDQVLDAPRDRVFDAPPDLVLDAPRDRVLDAPRPGRVVNTAVAGVLVASDLTPAEVVALDPTRVTGVVLAGGSPTGHAAILLRARGIPAVVAAGPAVLDTPAGTVVALDGTDGTLVSDPDPDTLDRLSRKRAAAQEADARAMAAAHRPAVTSDGVTVPVAANVGSPADARAAAESGADAAGLVRTEFLFLDRSTPPDQDEQVTAYRGLAEALDGRRLTLRTLDVGGDKPLPYLPVPPSANPFLGVPEVAGAEKAGQPYTKPLSCPHVDLRRAALGDTLAARSRDGPPGRRHPRR